MRIVDGWLDVALDGHYGAKSSSRDGVIPRFVVLHATAGGRSAAGIDDWFSNGQVGGQPVQASSHFIVDQQGVIIQGVSCDMSAWANGIRTRGHAAYLPDNINPNLYTISIEHVKSSKDNSDTLTPIQAKISFELIECICDTYGIPKRAGDARGGIILHADLDPVNRSRCPGPYPFDELWAFLKKGENALRIPQGWRDDPRTRTLTAPNKINVVLGFRDYILARNWDPANMPLGEEYAADPVQLLYPMLGRGTRQAFRDCMLWWTTAKGVVSEPHLGEELSVAYKVVVDLRAEIATLRREDQASDLKRIAEIASKYR